MVYGGYDYRWLGILEKHAFWQLVNRLPPTFQNKNAYFFTPKSYYYGKNAYFCPDLYTWGIPISTKINYWHIYQ